MNQPGANGESRAGGVVAPNARDRRQRRVLIGLALLFFAPLGLAFFLYYGLGGWLPGGRVNAGDLVNPARPLPPVALPLWGAGATDPNFLKGKWTFLQVAQGACGQQCLTRLYDTRQVRLALDRDMNRVQRVFVAEPDCCDVQSLHEQHPDLITLRGSADAAPLLALLQGETNTAAAMGSRPAESPRVYLIDPLGNLMMFYPANVKPKGMLEDLKRLLRLSSIG
jgi:hypothetical protein